MAQRSEMTMEIEKALKGMDYPASKQELVKKAKDNQAKESVIQAIEGFKENRFNSPSDVQKAWREER